MARQVTGPLTSRAPAPVTAAGPDHRRLDETHPHTRLSAPSEGPAPEDAFAFLASHELKAPVRIAKGFLQLLEKESADALGEGGTRYLDRAMVAINRLEAIIEGLLEYSRIDRSDQPAQTVPLGPLCEKAWTAVGKGPSSDTVALPPDLPAVMAEPRQLRILFEHVFANTVRYQAPERPLRVQVAALRDGAVVHVDVTDNGIGIPPDDHERVFTLFERASNVPDTKGLGLGLALVRRIAEHHGGSATIRDHGGPGTTLRITLPAVP